jgi:tripartite-type tricarboxylate transporter receptor subunit TctC
MSGLHAVCLRFAFISAVCVLTASYAAVSLAQIPSAGQGAAQGFPSRPVRIIVPAAPGGTIDIITRALSQKMTEGLGQPAIVENRAGSATTVAEEYVARSTPDGYTLMMAGTSRATNPHMYAKLGYDPVNDLTGISLVATSGNVLIVNPSLPAKIVTELVELAKSSPTPLFYGTAAYGSSGHLAAELFKQLAGVKLDHVPYKGAAPAIADLFAGQIHMTFDNIPVALPHIRSGRLRALGVTSASRSPLLPDVPTIAEAGLPGYEMTARFGLTAPARTPADVIARLNTEVVRALQTPQLKERFTGLGFDTVGSSPEEFNRLVATEYLRLGKLIKEAGLKPR